MYLLKLCSWINTGELLWHTYEFNGTARTISSIRLSAVVFCQARIKYFVLPGMTVAWNVVTLTWSFSGGHLDKGSFTGFSPVAVDASSWPPLYCSRKAGVILVFWSWCIVRIWSVRSTAIGSCKCLDLCLLFLLSTDLLSPCILELVLLASAMSLTAFGRSSPNNWEVMVSRGIAQMPMTWM